MNWTLSIWVAAALMALCRGQNIDYEGNSLSPSGYHLCIHNETRNLSYLVMHKVPYTVTKPCGGWLLWKTCKLTLYKMVPQTENKAVTEKVTKCCDGYVQVGGYCALPANRSGELIAKPGSCPTADGLCLASEDCEWDMDCPGWQKCCQRLGRSLCSYPTSSANYSVNGGYRWNATVTVKTDHQQLLSKVKGLLNHTRLLYAMVTGALQPEEVSVHYLSSWPVHPYRTATSLLIVGSSTLSPHSVITSKLHLLLKHIQEVSSVTVEDVDECVQSALHQCSPQAQCNNTVGSYQCSCHQGYIDVDPSNPGTRCTAGDAETPLTRLPPTNTTYTPAPNTTQEPPDSSTTVTYNSSEINMTTALSKTSPVPYNSSEALQWTSSAPYTSTSSTEELPLLTTTCSPPSITTLTLFNVTGTSFCVYWSSQLQTNQTYRVVLRKGSEVIPFLETNQTTMEVRGLQPGVLYNVSVTPSACGGEGVTQHVLVKTDAQTLDATTRLTNINFTADLHNSSSQAYKNLTASIMEEILQSLSPEVKALVESGQVRIEIRSFSAGSVVVNFTLTLTLAPNQTQDISNVSVALLNSLMNSSKFTVDRNSTSISDVNECESGENDCSPSATCTNTLGSYTCDCLDTFTDNNPGRPGRACQANASSETITPSPPPPAVFSSAGATPLSLMTSSASDPASTTVTTTPMITAVIISTHEMVSTTATPATVGSTISTPAATVGSTTSTPAATGVPLITTAPSMITTSNPPTTTAAAPMTMATAPATMTTDPATMTTAPTTTTTAPTGMATAATNTNSAPTTTNDVTNTTAAAPTTITVAPTAVATNQTTTTTAPTGMATAATTTSTTTTITTTATTTMTTITAPTTMNTVPNTPATAPTTMIMAPTTTATNPTTTTTAPTALTSATTTTSTTTTITTTAPTTMTSTPTISTIPTIATTPTTTTPTTTTMTPTIATTPTTTTTTPTIATTPTTTTTTPTIATTPTTTTTSPTMTRTTTKTAPRAITTTSTTLTTTSALAHSTVSVRGAISVQCRGSSITVTVAKEFLLNTNIGESALYLGSQECGVTGGNATHAQLTVAWNQCTTIFTHNETYNTVSVTLFSTMDPYGSPRARLAVPIMCPYTKNMLISAEFGSTGYDIIKDVITGLGSFHVTVQLMNGTIPLPHNYSLSPEDAVVVEVSLNTSSELIKVVINKCWGTSTPNPSDTQSYTFVENSCSVNMYTDVLMNGNHSTSRVSVQIFSFVNLDVIYLHCQVYICVQMGSDTCVPDCLQRTARSSNKLGTAFGSSGPLQRLFGYNLEEQVYDTAHIIGFSCLGVGLTIFFVLGFVCLFYYQRNRIGHYNFSVKPKQENFTYLVFNT